MSIGVPLGPGAGPFRQARIENGVTLDRANSGEVRIQRRACTRA